MMAPVTMATPMEFAFMEMPQQQAEDVENEEWHDSDSDEFQTNIHEKQILQISLKLAFSEANFPLSLFLLIILCLKNLVVSQFCQIIMSFYFKVTEKIYIKTSENIFISIIAADTTNGIICFIEFIPYH